MCRCDRRNLPRAQQSQTSRVLVEEGQDERIRRSVVGTRRRGRRRRRAEEEEPPPVHRLHLGFKPGRGSTAGGNGGCTLSKTPLGAVRCARSNRRGAQYQPPQGGGSSRTHLSRRVSRSAGFWASCSLPTARRCRRRRCVTRTTLLPWPSSTSYSVTLRRVSRPLRVENLLPLHPRPHRQVFGKRRQGKSRHCLTMDSAELALQWCGHCAKKSTAFCRTDTSAPPLPQQ